MFKMIHNDLLFEVEEIPHLSTYLLVCSSGGVPATSVLGSEVVLSTVTPAEPGDPAGDVAAVWGQNSLIAPTTQNLLFG